MAIYRVRIDLNLQETQQINCSIQIPEQLYACPSVYFIINYPPYIIKSISRSLTILGERESRRYYFFSLRSLLRHGLNECTKYEY
jgi:hypothetical protein